MYRDRVRCESLEHQGYHVYTLDDKHGTGSDMQIMESKKSPVRVRMRRNCNANFCDIRRLYGSIKQAWGTQMRFDLIALDYFFSPVSHMCFHSACINNAFFRIHGLLHAGPVDFLVRYCLLLGNQFAPLLSKG